MNRFLLLAPARRDLADIWRYTSNRWSTEQAERYTAGIVDACRALGAGERKGRAIDHVRAGYFKFPVGSHIIYYRVRDDGTCVVARILHERMDAPARLG
jgi:toxin ParE1/3/4